ncbi:hypothetical protein PHJA_000683900 [Phtheirospermum japonicum]|uniref:KIB1-4 beta-propeller domain-containing protein n=1 Tax=Phtheirospermum japonicum TaxID=374723 RepID=A0A830BGW0_9LAMI|nr:hypothetical protein PHJA_000683900 [Phtheirospermum japonicum]
MCWYRDWAGGVPVNVMDEILDRLVDLSDYTRFAAVCVAWRNLALDDRNRNHYHKVRCTSSTTQIPMLMLGGSGSGLFSNGGGVAEFYSVTRRKVLNNFRLPSPYHTDLRIIGSAFGWLINISKSDFPNVEVILSNPFLDSTIRIPSISSYSDFEQFNDYRHIVKATLSKDPALYPDEYVVLMIYGEEGKLAFLKPGDVGAGGRWRKLVFGGGFCDVIYSNSRGLFLGVIATTGKVCSIDVAGEEVVIDYITPALRFRERADKDNQRYIVETPSGDVLQVYRSSSGCEAEAIRTLKIKVFEFNETTICWCEMKSSLGNLALFVGCGSSLCVRASDFRGCRPGSVYYSFPYRIYSWIRYRYYSKLMSNGQPFDGDWRCYDVGVVDINTQRRESLRLKRYPSDWFDMMDASIHTFPIWVIPTFQHQKRRPREEEED